MVAYTCSVRRTVENTGLSVGLTFCRSFVSARNHGGGDDSSAEETGRVRREATMGRMGAVMASRRKSLMSPSGSSIRVSPQSSAPLVASASPSSFSEIPTTAHTQAPQPKQRRESRDAEQLRPVSKSSHTTTYLAATGQGRVRPGKHTTGQRRRRSSSLKSKSLGSYGSSSWAAVSTTDESAPKLTRNRSCSHARRARAGTIQAADGTASSSKSLDRPLVMTKS